MILPTATFFQVKLLHFQLHFLDDFSVVVEKRGVIGWNAKSVCRAVAVIRAVACEGKCIYALAHNIIGTESRVSTANVQNDGPVINGGFVIWRSINWPHTGECTIESEVDALYFMTVAVARI